MRFPIEMPFISEKVRDSPVVTADHVIPWRRPYILMGVGRSTRETRHQRHRDRGLRWYVRDSLLYVLFDSHLTRAVRRPSESRRFNALLTLADFVADKSASTFKRHVWAQVAEEM